MMSHGLKTKWEELEVDNSKVSTAALNKANPLHYVYIHVFFSPEATIKDTYWHCQMTIWQSDVFQLRLGSAHSDGAKHAKMGLKWNLWNPTKSCIYFLHSTDGLYNNVAKLNRP